MRRARLALCAASTIAAVALASAGAPGAGADATTMVVARGGSELAVALDPAGAPLTSSDTLVVSRRSVPGVEYVTLTARVP